jgi:hypothetical protein
LALLTIYSHAQAKSLCIKKGRLLTASLFITT